MRLRIIAVFLLLSMYAFARCDSERSVQTGGWKPVASAPRDGTIVEMAQTYGSAAWYGRFKWTNEMYMETSVDSVVTDKNGKRVPKRVSKMELVKMSAPQWVNVDKPNSGVGEECLYWRPIQNSNASYVDPTGGQQDKIEYWCKALGVPYNKKTDQCVPK